MDIKARLEELGLTPDNSIVIGSGILNALGIRESKDIDLVVSEDVYERILDNPRFHEKENHGKEILANDVFEIGTFWVVLGKTWKLKDFTEHSVIMDGVRYITPKFLLDAKKSWVDTEPRDKDIKDIDLLEEYLSK